MEQISSFNLTSYIHKTKKILFLSIHEEDFLSEAFVAVININLLKSWNYFQFTIDPHVLFKIKNSPYMCC